MPDLALGTVTDPASPPVPDAAAIAGLLADECRRRVVAALVLGSVTLVAFVPPGLLLGPAAAAAGLALYAGLLALLRPSGLVSAWRYLRALT